MCQPQQLSGTRHGQACRLSANDFRLSPLKIEIKNTSENLKMSCLYRRRHPGPNYRGENAARSDGVRSGRHIARADGETGVHLVPLPPPHRGPSQGSRWPWERMLGSIFAILAGFSCNLPAADTLLLLLFAETRTLPLTTGKCALLCSPCIFQFFREEQRWGKTNPKKEQLHTASTKPSRRKRFSMLHVLCPCPNRAPTSATVQREATLVVGFIGKRGRGDEAFY